MENKLLENLKANDKQGLFTPNASTLSYNTGFMPYDYRNGYLVESRDPIDPTKFHTYASTGLTAGTVTTIIGKPGTAKTTFAAQVAANITSRFDNGLVLHLDLEQALTYTRLRNITKMSFDQMEGKYILKQGQSNIESIYETIHTLAIEKFRNPKEYKYDTGLNDEFGNRIFAFVPTFVILDSVPSLTSSELTKNKDGEIDSATVAGRMAQKIKNFLVKAVPMFKETNINLIMINHINTKMEINPMMKTQAQLMYMKNTESMPGGNAPIYYSTQLIKFVSRDKYNSEEHGFDGFKTTVELLKSRGNKAGQSCELIYNQSTGFDPLLTMTNFATEHGLVGGRNPYRYFVGYEDVKFDSRKIVDVVKENPDVLNSLMRCTHKELQSQLTPINRDIDYTEQFKMIEDAIRSED